MQENTNFARSRKVLKPPEQVDLLTQMGVDGLQGFQLSTPRSAAESLDLITASAA